MIEFDSHGFSVVDVTPERLQMDWWYLRSERTPDRPQHDRDAAIVHGQSWQVVRGSNQVSPAQGPSPSLSAAMHASVPTLRIRTERMD